MKIVKITLITLLFLLGSIAIAQSGEEKTTTTPPAPTSTEQATEETETTEEAETEEFPKIVAPEQRFDFGYSPEGFFLVHAYALRNEGNAELTIQRVRTTCGCTKAPLKKMELEPGEEVDITLIFNSSRYRHSTSKSAIITSNDPVNRSVRVTFTANMDTTGFVFSVEPWGLDIPVGTDPPETMVFDITNDSDNKVKLRVVDYTEGVLSEPRLLDDELKSGGKTKLELTLTEEFDAAMNYIQASVTIEASGLGEDGSQTMRFTLPVKGSGPQ